MSMWQRIVRFVFGASEARVSSSPPCVEVPRAPRRPARARPGVVPHMGRNAISEARRNAIEDVLFASDADAPLSKREIIARVRKITVPPVRPRPRCSATGNLLCQPPLRDMLERVGTMRSAKWRLKPAALAVMSAARAKPVRAATSSAYHDERHRRRIENEAIARAVLVAQGPMAVRALLPLVNERVAPNSVSRYMLCDILTSPGAPFRRIGKARSPDARWEAA